MQTRIIRPDLRVTDQYKINCDESMLMWIEDGLLKKINDVYVNLDGHAECDLRSETGCVVREKWLIQQYGDLLTARTAGYFPSDCTEDLAFLHTELGKLADSLRQARWIRSNPQGKWLYELTSAETQLLQIRGEVIAREAAGSVPTGPLPILDDETLAALDKAKSEGSLLGLDGEINATTKPTIVEGTKPQMAEPVATTTKPAAAKTATPAKTPTK